MQEVDGGGIDGVEDIKYGFARRIRNEDFAGATAKPRGSSAHSGRCLACKLAPGEETVVIGTGLINCI
jgi:hypothetical protein